MAYTRTQLNMPNERGFNLVEIVVAAGIISLSLVFVIATAGRSIALSHQAQATYGASVVLEEGSEAVRVVRDNAWSDISALASGTTYYPVFDPVANAWSLSTDPTNGVEGIYTRSIVPGDVFRDGSDNINPSGGGTLDPGTRSFVVNVTWLDSNGKVESKSATFYLSNIFS